MKINLYKTEHCPMCKMLSDKLNEKNIPYNVITDRTVMKEKNITFVPVLEVNNQLFSLQQALKWVGEQ